MSGEIFWDSFPIRSRQGGREGGKTLRGDRRTADTVAAEDIARAVATARRAEGAVTATALVVILLPILFAAGHRLAAVSRYEGCEADFNQDQRRELHFCGFGSSVERVYW